MSIKTEMLGENLPHCRRRSDWSLEIIKLIKDGMLYRVVISDECRYVAIDYVLGLVFSPIVSARRTAAFLSVFSNRTCNAQDIPVDYGTKPS